MTGVQTCALPISFLPHRPALRARICTHLFELHIRAQTEVKKTSLFVTAQVGSAGSSGPQFGDQVVGLGCEGGKHVPALLSGG